VMTDDMLPEYSYITTVHDVPTPEGILSAGAVGCVVMVYPEHRAYLVEFEAPWHVLSLGHDTVVPNDELERFPVWLNRDSLGRRNRGFFGTRFGFERVPWPNPIRRTYASAW
jgi:hypothetical protein